MPKYDAFGREIGEDTLSGLGGEPSSTPAPPPVPQPAEGWTEAQPAMSAGEVPIAPAPAPDSPPPTFQVPGGFTAPKRRRGGARIGAFGCLFSLVFLAAILVGPIIALVAFLDDAEDTVTSITETFEPAAPNAPADPDAPAAPAEPPTGVEGRSMIRPKRLAAAIATLEAQKGQLGSLTVWPDRVNATLITKRDNETNHVVTYEDELREGDPVDVGIPRDILGWDNVDPQVPARLVQNSAKRFNVRPQGINYLIASPPNAFTEGPVQWIAYFKNGIYVMGDARGNVVRKISG